MVRKHARFAMSNAHNLDAMTKLEREVLRLLCNLPDRPPDRARSHALCNVSSHDWKDADHRVVFDALRRSPGKEPALLREQLPAEATRLGFPDVDWADYFAEAISCDSKKIEQLTRELLLASGEDARQL
jgi:hypothetical protein